MKLHISTNSDPMDKDVMLSAKVFVGFSLIFFILTVYNGLLIPAVVAFFMLLITSMILINLSWRKKEILAKERQEKQTDPRFEGIDMPSQNAGFSTSGFKNIVDLRATAYSPRQTALITFIGALFILFALSVSAIAFVVFQGGLLIIAASSVMALPFVVFGIFIITIARKK